MKSYAHLRIRMDLLLRKKLQAIATKENRSLSNLGKTAIESFVTQYRINKNNSNHLCRPQKKSR